MNLDDALHTFVAESRDLLQHMEQALLRLESAPADSDTINALFRAAHTIKGSSGLFGLDHVVTFTHVAESVLDRVRAGGMALDAELAALLFEVCDHLVVLIDHVADGRLPETPVQATGAALVQRLQLRLGERVPAAVAPLSAEPPRLEAEGGGAVDTDNWHLSLRFGKDVLRQGLDPLSFIRYLCTFGEIVIIVTLADQVPALSALDPESCHLGFEINFRSDADKAAIEGAFDFVREDSLIRILPPHSKAGEYLRLIEEMPEAPLKLGEMLVRCGTLTPAELESVLSQQSRQTECAPQPIGEMLVAQGMVQPAVVEAALDKQRQIKEARGGEVSLIRVDAAKLDRLIDLVGELIIAGAGSTVAARRNGASDLIEATTAVSRLVEEVRESALDLRMVQIGATFNRFQRVVRDVSRELGKAIDLAISGADTELDKTVVERIADPLTHLVRNAMDHGIEPAELRAARGKPERGTVRLNAFHDAGSVVIEVADDGGGLSKDRILRKAVERGLLAEGQVPADKDLFNLIFEPGFSTADQVSNLSGRGVGMDVVKRNITALRGTVDLDSAEGRGTTVHIRLPLTLAIIDGFLVGVGRAAYVVPLDMVVECIELTREQSAASGGRNYLNLRGDVLPFIRLRELFDVRDDRVRRENVVVVQHGGQRAGLVVDQLMGEFQTVIKPLGPVFGQMKGVSGFTILGSGEVALILDVSGLIRQVVSRTQEALEAA